MAVRERGMLAVREMLRSLADDRFPPETLMSRVRIDTYEGGTFFACLSVRANPLAFQGFADNLGTLEWGVFVLDFEDGARIRDDEGRWCGTLKRIACEGRPN
jgi:hypothetical protein